MPTEEFSQEWAQMAERGQGIANGRYGEPLPAPASPCELTAEPASARRWPEPLDVKALHGIAGDFVRLVEPHTEADPAALLLHFLVAAGNLCGRKVYALAEGMKHSLNLFAVFVGQTSHGRKGSALAQVKRFLRAADPEFINSHVQTGLSSGEGLIWAVRDAIERREPVKEHNRFTGEYDTYESDPGIQDKRLLVVESEFASTLKVAGREGNTLSPTIRQAWDSGDLRTMTKNSPARATDAHISIIGHVTSEELLRHLDSTEAANGFANRFLWVCVRRSKLLPFGGNLQDSDFGRLVVSLLTAKEWCETEHHLAFGAQARQAWALTYRPLSAGRAGLLGAVLGRAEAQVLRISCMYAMLDCSAEIKLEHLEAAIAVWEYCERSAEFIFGDSLGDPAADAILSALRANANGLSRTEIRDIFSRNLTANRIERALGSLAMSGLAAPQHLSTGGRPLEKWVALATTKATDTTKDQQ